MVVDERTIDMIREKLEKHEICLTEYGVRLMKVEDNAKEIKDLAFSVREIAINQKNMSDNVEEKFDNITHTMQTIVNDVKTLSDEPKKSWSTLKTAVISSIGSCIGTTLLLAFAYFMIFAK